MTPAEFAALIAAAEDDAADGRTLFVHFEAAIGEIERLHQIISDMEDELTVWRANCEWPD